MKLAVIDGESEGNPVAPRRGAWIEMTSDGLGFDFNSVAPRRGAWIEIAALKKINLTVVVAPRRGAWIEIFNSTNCKDVD